VIWNRHRNAKEKDLSMDASEIAKIRRITAEMAAITHRMPENSWGCPALTDRADGLSGYLPEILLSG
jgi:hypothetical protein